MTLNGTTNGRPQRREPGLPDNPPTEPGQDPAEPVQIKSFAVTYDRKFNLGNYESLAPAITIWIKRTDPDGEGFDLHHAKERVRRMARENVRAQLLRQQGDGEVVFLGLQPPNDGRADPILIRTVSVSLVCKVNLGDYNAITPGYSDWADLRHVADSPGELHLALARMWQSLWANIDDEIARARGHGSRDGFFGLPAIEVEDLTGKAAAGTPLVNGRQSLHHRHRAASTNGAPA